MVTEKYKILIVEDDEGIVELLKAKLEESGYAISVAMDGITAIDMAIQLDPDLIILDVMLPHLDGFGVCAELKLDRGTSKIPILMCTAQNSLADIEKGFSFGINGYIIKPFDFEKVLVKIKQILGK